MATPKQQLLVLEDGALRQVARRLDVLAEFAFLNQLNDPANQKTGKRCNTCGTPAEDRRDIINQIKRTLVAMAAAKRNRFKELLNAQRVQVVFMDQTRKLRYQEL